ncbi:hypothetical protein AB205_0118580 [Aquarana catesbeiana]|uniref:EGF-like domain-containing protein n=1 Tax=Aquarana catesbeiana TaxID=8400 RepID=A0A2G9SA77_AQUCT|nr:hypothetical protein AB205_0118580 [Aquarana catesbeiana]
MIDGRPPDIESAGPAGTVTLCEINIDDCEPNPCLNGGSCQDSVNNFKCICNSSFSGVRCEVSDVLPTSMTLTSTIPILHSSNKRPHHATREVTSVAALYNLRSFIAVAFGICMLVK